MMSSFIGFDYQLSTSCLLDSPSPEVDALVGEMREVADACVWDAHASAQYSISSMIHKDYGEVPTKPGESPFAFALPDKEAQAVDTSCNNCGWTHDVEFEAMSGEPAQSRGTRELADHIVALKRAGNDTEALELLLGGGGRVVEGFGSQPNPWRPTGYLEHTYRS